MTSTYSELSPPVAPRPKKRPLEDPGEERNSKGPTESREFTLLPVIHSGKLATIRCAKDDEGRLYCLKTVKRRQLNSGRHKRKKLQIATATEEKAYEVIAKSNTCRYIMDLYGVFEDDGHIYFAMECMATTMFDVIKSPVGPGRSRKWIAQISLGIDALHKMGIFHRDLKPENILVDELDNIRIFDFGTAHVSTGVDGKPREDDSKGKLVGTPRYHAPEYSSQGISGPMMDYWALGCIVWDIIVGHFFIGEEGQVYIEWKGDMVSCISPPDAALNAVTEQVKELLCKLLHRDPIERYKLDRLKTLAYFGANAYYSANMNSVAATAPDSSTSGKIRLKAKWINR